MTPVVLVGAGGHGRGTLEILRARAAAGLATPVVLGFVDDDPARHGSAPGGLPVLGGTDWLIARAAAGEPVAAILAIASARAKKAVDGRLRAAGVPFATAVHPAAVLAGGVVVGEGAIVNAGVCVAYDTRLGRHTTVNLNATVGHDCVVGDYSTVAPGVNITGNVTLGEGCEVQTNTTIVPGITLGEYVKVGPASLVLRDVAAGQHVFGNPARPVPGVGGA
jgi:sugar O-acyltransferase (sialic acid O-acetyltransferase NeuD family)